MNGDGNRPVIQGDYTETKHTSDRRQQYGIREIESFGCGQQQSGEAQKAHQAENIDPD